MVILVLRLSLFKYILFVVLGPKMGKLLGLGRRLVDSSLDVEQRVQMLLVIVVIAAKKSKTEKFNLPKYLREVTGVRVLLLSGIHI